MHVQELVADSQDGLHVLTRTVSSQSVLLNFSQTAKYVRPVQVAHTRETVTADLDINCNPKLFLEESRLKGADSRTK